MTDSTQDKKELIHLAVTGTGENWNNLQSALLQLVEGIVRRMHSKPSQEAGDDGGSVAADISVVTSNWVRAKIDHPTLENEKIRAEIESAYAEARKRQAEARKLDAEARKIDAEALEVQISSVEKVLRSIEAIGQVTFMQRDGSGHLLLGPNPKSLSLPKSEDKSNSD